MALALEVLVVERALQDSTRVQIQQVELEERLECPDLRPALVPAVQAVQAEARAAVREAVVAQAPARIFGVAVAEVVGEVVAEAKVGLKARQRYTAPSALH